MSTSYDEIAKLLPEERELFELLLRQEGLDLSPYLPIPRRREADALPLSFAQERFWFLDQWEPGSPAYNIPLALRVIGSLNVAALEQSFNEILRRHEILRARCFARDGQPVQVIIPSLSLALQIVDLGELSESERGAEAQRLATEEARRPFDLARGPLLRVSLLRLSESEHVLLVTTHHFVVDGWSMRVLMQELSALYQAFSRGELSPLPELPIQYADFSRWQRAWLRGEVLEAQLAYWKKRLDGAPAVLDLPTDRPRPALQSYQGATQSFTLPAVVSEALKALSRREGVTLFMTLLAAFQTLLHRYTHQEEILVGTEVSTRNRAETEGLIGSFANNVVLRSDFSGNPTFRELLGRVRKVAQAAYAHQDLPFEKLVEKLQLERDLSCNPLFQVMFVLHQSALERNLELPGLTLGRLPIEMGTARFDLRLDTADGEGELSGSLEYNTDLFEASTITRMLGHFQTLLEGIITDPDERLSTLPLLTVCRKAFSNI